MATKINTVYSQNRCIARNNFKFLNRIGFFLAVNRRPGTRLKHFRALVHVIETVMADWLVAVDAGINEVVQNAVRHVHQRLLFKLYKEFF